MPKVRQAELDYDYLDKLNHEEKEWLNKFTDEYLNASFKHNKTDIQSYEKYGKSSNDRNNARNRDLYGILSKKDARKLIDFNGKQSELEYELQKSINPKSMENAYLDYIEHKQLEKIIKEYETAMASFSEVLEGLPQPQEELLQHSEPSIPQILS